MNNIVTLFIGVIFGFGLALSGMTHPQRVLDFLDVTGTWNPSLLFVLGGAVGVTLIAFRLIHKLGKPVFAAAFHLTDARHIDAPLVIGSILFGLGWGISGYCPGPALALLAAPNWELWVFVPAMLIGYTLQYYLSQSQRSLTTDRDETSVCG